MLCIADMNSLPSIAKVRCGTDPGFVGANIDVYVSIPAAAATFATASLSAAAVKVGDAPFHFNLQNIRNFRGKGAYRADRVTKFEVPREVTPRHRQLPTLC